MIGWLSYRWQRLVRLWLNLTAPKCHTAHGPDRPEAPYRSWGSLRRAYIRRNPRCILCGTSRQLEVHHIVPRHVAPERALEWDNLATLCRRDHFVHGHDHSYRNRWVPNIIAISSVFSATRAVADNRDKEN